MGIRKKLKFWRRRRDVGAASQVHIDDLHSKLEERVGNHEELEATLL
jgi:hypothetical protein